MIDDNELLRRYSRTRSQEAFSEVVRRNVDMVYTAALRQLRGDHHKANEVTQMVFADLCRKAASLASHPLIPAWLHRSTRFSALRVLRAESRRRHYEQAAGQEMALFADLADSLPWERVRPVLDEAIDELPEADRHAVLLRYFSNRAYGDLGRQLGLSENAARMRVDRALDKLRDRLAGKGITSSSTALAAALAGNAVSAAPSGAVLAAAQAATLGSGLSAGGWIAFMTTSKLPLTLAAAALVCGTGALALQERIIAQMNKRLDQAAATSSAISDLEAKNRQLQADAHDAQALRDAAAALPQLRTYAAALRERAAQKASRAAVPLQTAGNVAAVPLSQLNMMPRPKMQVRPMYPAALKQMGYGGQVLVDFIVGPDGTVYNAFALSSSVDDGTGAQPATPPASQAVRMDTFTTATQGGQASGASPAGSSAAAPGSDVQPGATDFAAAAVQAVSQWQFAPGQINGHAVYTHMQVPIVFSPNGSPTAAGWF
jgi:RNA polymerase sigma factor (sigma-70 family)